jgi:glycosyltransferase involved in cell wall biosynthesis
MPGKSDRMIVARRLEAETDNSPIRVSYIIATMNRGEYLRRTLTNVREFLSDEDELIVIDGGSTDSTAQVIQENRDIVSIFVSEHDGGEGHAFNKGLSLARGRFIKPITDDDYFYPDAMLHLIATGERLPEADAIMTGGEIWKVEAGEPKFVEFYRVADEVKNPSQLDIFKIYSGLGLLVRRRAVLKTGGITAGYLAVDGDFHCKLLQAKCDVRYLDIDLYRWYRHPHSGVNDFRVGFDNMILALRLANWRGFYGLEPRFAARVTGLDATPDGVGFQSSIYFSYKIWRSKARIVLRLLPFISDCVRSIHRYIRGLVQRRLNGMGAERATNHGASMPFTGKLFPGI